MPRFFLADVRKRANADSNLTPRAIPEPHTVALEGPGALDAASAAGQDYVRMIEQFSAFGGESPDEPVVCALSGAGAITMEWTADPVSAQMDLYSAVAGEEEPVRFLTLYFFSGADPDATRRLLRPLESYADFSECTQYPLVLRVIDDPLPAAWQHAALESLRHGLPALVAAFLKVYFPDAVPAAS